MNHREEIYRALLTRVLIQEGNCTTALLQYIREALAEHECKCGVCAKGRLASGS